MNEIVFNNFIADYFELPITEAIDDYYTKEEFIKEVELRIIELNKLGYILSVNQIIKYDIIDTNKITAGVKSIDTNKYCFVISKSAARKRNTKYFDTIIYHELCHILQLDFLFNNGLFYYKDSQLTGTTANKTLIDKLYGTDNNHTAFWYAFVNNINKKLLINPPVAEKLSDKDLTDIFLESIYSADFPVDSFITDYFELPE